MKAAAEHALPGGSLTRRRAKSQRFELPTDEPHISLQIGESTVELTNLQKVFWPDTGITKRDLLQYYIDIAPVLLPHLTERAMVMKRYPHGAYEPFFFMKRAPAHKPPWLATCAIEHGSGSVINFPMVNDIASLLWIVNLGCIDLNPWYARCDDVSLPDYLHFDLDPVPGASFERVREAGSVVIELLRSLRMKPIVKTSGSKGLHVYVPIVRGPAQKQVWSFAKEVARILESRHPKLLTAEYRIARRPKGRVLVDYNQNAWGRTLASVYSVRPRPLAPVSTPITLDELERAISIEDYTLHNVPQRVEKLGDLWRPLLAARGRFDLAELT